MKVLTYQTLDGRTATWVDRKRPFWALALLYALLPLGGILLHALTGNELALFLPISFTYVIAPIIDLCLGEADDNPPEQVVRELEDDGYYRVLTYAIVPLAFITVTGAAYWIGTHHLTWGVVALGLATGVTGGLCITTGHELGHKQSPLERSLTKFLLAVPAYGHFWVDHNRGHHRHVATPEDPVSARMGESIYRFALREIPGAMRRAWNSEADRLGRTGRSAWSWRNEILQSYAISAVLQIGLIIAFGPIMIPFLLLNNGQAWWLLTSANYVEHYGLLRARSSRGRYERCEPHHSWNCNRVFTNLLLFHLERHSDHHSHPTRRYQSLRHFDDLPQLPSGYLGMFSIALIPPLWFRIMDPLLLKLTQVQGDLNKVNIDPVRRAKLFARYGQQNRQEA
ncbi:MAG TPA: alkane 1-monooxygenase [Vicinamibacterales bacterium]|nr:alkane 1-monooxygenase [Vicinamibacterales bacterium]